MMDKNPMLNMKVSHFFILKINGKRNRDITIYNDREFQMIVNQYGGNLPTNVRACHFPADTGPDPIVFEGPPIDFPIYELTQPRNRVTNGLRLYWKHGPRKGVPIISRYFNYVWAVDPEDHHECQHGLVALVDGKEYKFLDSYTARPTSLSRACQFINWGHRHNVAPQGHKFSLELTSGDMMVGVLIASEPKSRYLCDGYTLEINRICTNELYHNVCSALIGKAVRMGKEMGYTRFITYTLSSESGASMLAAGFRPNGIVKGRPDGWNSKSRPRAMPERYPTGDKQRWVLQAGGKKQEESEEESA